MGGSSKQVTGYRYFANFLLFIGNPIEKVLGINFDKRGWQTPLIDEQKNPLPVGVVDLPNLYGENEGGVKGLIHAKYGTKTQSPVDFYVDYLAKNDLAPLAYRYQSYLAFKEFYLGNSGYMKEMLLWPKRIRVRNDGLMQWYVFREDGAIVCEIGSRIGSEQDAQYGGRFTAEWSVTEKNSLEGDVITNQQKTLQKEGGSGEKYILSPRNPVFQEGYAVANRYTQVGDQSFETKITYNISVKEGALTLLEFECPVDLTGSIHFARVIKGNADEFELVKIETLNEKYNRIKYMLKAKVFVERGKSFEFEVGSKGHTAELSDGAIYNNQTAIVLNVRREKATWSFDIDALDINPIHKIREILTDDTAMNKPESDVNDVNFMKAADRIYEEGLGISWSITEKSCLEAINELCGHIEAGVRVNRQTGLYEMVLFRDDWFEESEIHTLAVKKIKSMSLEVANADEAINQLNVSYYNRDAIKYSSFSIAENASIRNLNGRVNAEDADFPYFMNQRNAAVVAQWKLKQMSSPVWSGSFTTAAYEARKWNRYDLLKLAWPRKWQGTITVRIMKINLGIGTDASIDFVEVVPYSSNLSSDIVIDTPIDIAPLPPQVCQYEPFEMPYYLAVMALGQRQVDEELSYENNFGLVAVVAEKPQSNSLYAVMMTHDGTEGEEWVRAATINYEPVADLDQVISRTSASFTVKDSTAIAELPIGTLIKCGSDWIGTPGEWMVFQGVDPYTGVLSVKRGALDSLPQDWGVNTKLYFCGNDVAFDSSEYVSGEEILVSALTTTPSGMFENKGSIGVEMNARAFRPYPPANVKFNGNYFPETHVISSDILLTWAHRNRVQQTGGEIIGWYEDGVTLENGVTYSLELSTVQDGVIYSASDIGLDSHTIPASALLPNKAHKLKLWSVRNGFDSYTIFEHNFFAEAVSLILTASVTSNNASGNTVPTANIAVDVDTSLKANMQFDGSGIIGKTLPNSTITIEIED